MPTSGARSRPRPSRTSSAQKACPSPSTRGGSAPKARLPHDVWRVEAVALGQGQEPLEAGGVQGVAAREEDDGRSVLRAEGDDVRVAEARADGQKASRDPARPKPRRRAPGSRPRPRAFCRWIRAEHPPREEPIRPVSVAGVPRPRPLWTKAEVRKVFVLWSIYTPLKQEYTAFVAWPSRRRVKAQESCLPSS